MFKSCQNVSQVLPWTVSDQRVTGILIVDKPSKSSNLQCQDDFFKSGCQNFSVSISQDDLLMTSLIHSFRFSKALGIHSWFNFFIRILKPLDVYPFFNSRCFFWLVVRERRARPQTILLVQMQQTFREVAKVLLESSGRIKVQNYI